MEKKSFSDFNLSQEILKAVTSMGFKEATPIQIQTIDAIMNGEDIVAQAPTGTGKTCAFGIPLIEQIDSSSRNIQGMVLCPTRELVIQTSNELTKLCKFKRGVKIVSIYGGQQISKQIYELKKMPQIIVATPGRLMDHMRRRTIRLNSLSHVILDEADEMLNMGFREDINVILKSVNKNRQTVLFSATLSKDILAITHNYQRNYKLIKVMNKNIPIPKIDQFYIELNSNKKLDALTRLIDSNNYGLAIVFCNTKRMVDMLTKSLSLRGYSVDALHGDIKQLKRDKVMSKFKNGNINILVATDVAARGIDVNNVEAVFNYDLPVDEEYYIHRIGRTGRANNDGVSYTFIGSREIYKLNNIMKYTKSKIKSMKIPNKINKIAL
ncbi:MAG: DEAD/DEAH box helicase [Eubacteriales bacterium]